MLFYKRSKWCKHLRDIGLTPMDAVCWVSWGEHIKTVLLCWFIGLYLLLILISWYWSCFVCSILTYMKYTVELVCLHTYILYGLLSCDSSLTCKKCWLCLCTPLHSCWWFRTPLDYELSLLLDILFLDYMCKLIKTCGARSQM